MADFQLLYHRLLDSAGSENLFNFIVAWNYRLGAFDHLSSERATSNSKSSWGSRLQYLVRRKRTRSIEYAFIFRKCDDEAGLEIARGTLVVASVRRQADHSMISVPIPEHIAAKIEVAPPDRLN